MLDLQELEKSVRDLIVDLCGVLYHHGYQEVSVGALMRLIGVDPERAQAHDSNFINLHEHFSTHTPIPKNQKIPPGTVFH